MAPQKRREKRDGGDDQARDETDWTKWKRGELSTFYPGVRRTEGRTDGTERGSEGNFCGEEKNSIVGVVGARRQAAHARGGDFRPSDGQIQNEDEEEGG